MSDDAYTHYLAQGAQTQVPATATTHTRDLGLSTSKPKRPTSGVPRSAVTGKAVNISPSAFSTYHACQLQWWLGYVARLRSPSSGAQALGVGVHAVAERYLWGRQDWADPTAYDPKRNQGVEVTAQQVEIFEPGIPLLPTPGTVGTEAWVKLRAGPLPFVGQVDVYPRLDTHGDPTPYHPLAKWWIADHKSRSSFFWAPSSAQLANDVQLHCYAYGSYHDLPGGPPAEVGLTHINYLTKYTTPAKCRKCRGSRVHKGAPCSCGPRAVAIHSPPVAWEKISRTWHTQIVPTAEAMVGLILEAEMGRIPTAKYPQKTCKAYGGCDYAKNGMCHVGRRVLGTKRASLIGLPYDLPPEVADYVKPLDSTTKPKTQGSPMNPNDMTPEQRKMFGLPPLDNTPTPAAMTSPAPAATASPAPAATASPAVAVEQPHITDPQQRKMFGLAPLPAGTVATIEPAVVEPVAVVDPVLPEHGALNPPDAPPTPTPTAEIVKEAARHVVMADELRAKAGMDPATDKMIEGILVRVRLPTDSGTLDQVKALARDTTGTASATPVGGIGPAGAVNPTPPPEKADPDNVAAAEAIRDAMQNMSMLPYESKGDTPTVKAILIEHLRQKRPRKKRALVVLELGASLGYFTFTAGRLDVYPASPTTTVAPTRTTPQVVEVAVAVEQVEQVEAAVEVKVVEVVEAVEAEQVEPAVEAEQVEPAVEAEVVEPAVEAEVAEPAVEAEIPQAALKAAVYGGSKVAIALPHVMFVLYVDCLPSDRAPDITLSQLLKPLEAQAASDGKVPHYLQLGYRNGQEAVACLLSELLYTEIPNDGFGAVPFRSVYIDSGHPCAKEALPVLEGLPGVMVVRAMR